MYSFFFLLVAACSGGHDDKTGKRAGGAPPGEDTSSFAEYVPDYDDSDCSGDFDWTSWSDRSRFGVVDATVDLPPGRSLQITVEAEQEGISTMVSAVVTPDGTRAYTWEDWNNTNQNYTYAAYPEAPVSTMNYPVRASDPPYTSGTWAIELFTLDRTGDYIDDVPVSIRLYVNEDDDVETGCVYVDLVFADGLADEPEVSEAAERAVARWNQIWLAYGLKVIPLHVVDSSLDADVPSPRAGDDRYAALGSDSDPILRMVVGERIAGEGALGESGSIPGSLAQTPHAAVALSWLQHAGSDGVFSDVEVRTMGETMAHEASHYLGLFHPVEISDGEPSSFDALSDTPGCESRASCDDVLESNLMYPYATGALQEELTAEQVGVLQRWSGTL